MFHKRFVLCSAAALLAVAVACSNTPTTPVSPGATLDGTPDAAADGATLKVTAPTPVSPVNNAQPDTLTLVTNKVTGKFGTVSPNYEFQVNTAAGAAVAACASTVGAGTASTVSYTPTCQLDFDTPYSWRVRAVVTGAVGPWSSAATFRTPSGGYIRDREIFDPLTNGKTVGTRVGATQFIAGKGIELMTPLSYVVYDLPQNLQAGEFSLMATGIDEGSPGDKSKVMSMMEGSGDITTNDYRMTVEKRGRDYVEPGAVTFRIISGDSKHESGRVNDGQRFVVPMNDESWYFWKFTWSNRAALEVREGSPTGRVIYSTSVGMGGFPYRPVPHRVFLGGPVGRAGPLDATIPGLIIKNVWVSGLPRPNFPGLFERP